MLDIIRGRIERERIPNIELVLGTTTDPRLPRAAVDLAIMVDVYHEFSQPQVMLRRIRESLKPGGRLVLLEYRGEDPKVPILPAAQDDGGAGPAPKSRPRDFALTTVKEDLPWQHVLVFTVK